MTNIPTGKNNLIKEGKLVLAVKQCSDWGWVGGDAGCGENQGEPWVNTREVTGSPPRTPSGGLLGMALGAAPVDLWVLRSGTALLNVCSQGRQALALHIPSTHTAINIKRCRRRDWKIGLWAKYCSELGRGNESEFLSSHSCSSTFTAEGDKERKSCAPRALRGGVSSGVTCRGWRWAPPGPGCWHSSRGPLRIGAPPQTILDARY